MKSNDDSAALYDPSGADTRAGGPSVSAAQRRVLLIAYHFPPDAASTGRLRTLGFARHLPAFGWQPAVLTANTRAYTRLDEAGTEDIPASCTVQRAFALDTRRHLGWRGKYLSLLATPDRWITWWPDAVRVGLRMIKNHQIDAIWSTFPIMTSHLIGLSLCRLTGLPWIADFRDPVVSDGRSLNQRVCRLLEQRVVNRARCSIFTTPGAKRLYVNRFSSLASGDKFSVIPNGYEEEKFRDLARPEKRQGAPCTLVHSGLLYRDGRNPYPFFMALAELKSESVIDKENVRIVLRASGHQQEYATALDDLDVADLVELAPPVSYHAALQEQASADGLLLFQGRKFNAQIPAKVYDYLRIGAPIFALTDATGDTANLLCDIDGATIVRMDDVQVIRDALTDFLSSWRNRTLVSPDASIVQRYSRYAGAERLAGILSEVTDK